MAEVPTLSMAGIFDFGERDSSRFLVFVFLERGARNILRKRRLKHTPEGHILIGQFLEVMQLFFILLCRTKSMG